MSAQYPECPLNNHKTCGEIANPRVCAIVREDMVCLLGHLKEAKETIAIKVIKKTRKDLFHGYEP